MNGIIPPSQEAIFESLIEGYLTQNYGICEHFLEPDLASSLRENLLNHYNKGDMHPAGIGRKFDYRQNLEIRGDVIKWIENDTSDPAERSFFKKVDSFIRYLNQTCFAGINDYEFHYAYYAPGSFYKKHLDQFKSSRGRKFSFVTYLNIEWEENDGGHLILYPGDGQAVRITPKEGKSLFFKSDKTEHEVKASPLRPRFSIAGWFKSI